MLTGLRFPNGKVYSLDDIEALEVPELPAPLNYIREMFDVREWDGTPHVTDLLRGLRESYLEYTTPYARDVDDLAYSIMGKRTHANIEGEDGEVPIAGYGIQGTTDIVELAGTRKLRLVDTKNQGSYAVAKALGLYQEDEYIRDENNNPVMYKSGQKKGQYKTRKVTKRDPEKVDWGTIQMQLNIYRVIANEMLADRIRNFGPLLKWRGCTVGELKVFFIVRDGGTAAAFSRGVYQRTYYVNVPLLPDEKVWDFIQTRGSKLKHAIENREIPEPCSPEEAWHGKKCSTYCAVAKACLMNGDNPYITEKELT